ncbi:MAG: fumarylacetoacetate hydrolase family protein [Thermoleophilia bacterium]
MKLVQFYTPDQGMRLGLLYDGLVHDLTEVEPAYFSFMALLERAGGQAATLERFVREKGARVPEQAIYEWEELDRVPDPSFPHLLVPIFSPEVWGFGVTYRRSAETRDADHQVQNMANIYNRVYNSERPECFFKATAARCVGPNGHIGIRSDSELTATEPELAFILGANKEIIGYTICNDVSAWDLERQNPLYLPQSKIYAGCCALGPMVVTATEIPDPYSLGISCRILRGGEEIFSGSTNSGLIGRTFEELNEYLYRDNPIPLGTVVSTGTGIMVPNELCLRDGDTVEILIEGIGRLSNPVRKL